MGYRRQPVVAVTGAADHEIELDTKFKVPIVITVPHHEIHEGASFSVDHLEVGAGFSLCFKVPAGTKRCHMVISWTAESKGEIQLWEGREWDAETGSLKTIYNRDRNSSNTSQIQENQSSASFVANSAVILTPDNIGTGSNAAGTEVHHWETWSDKKTTYRDRGLNEWILKNDEVYVVTFVSNDGSKGAHVELDWYEHTDK